MRNQLFESNERKTRTTTRPQLVFHLRGHERTRGEVTKREDTYACRRGGPGTELLTKKKYYCDKKGITQNHGETIKPARTYILPKKICPHRIGGDKGPRWSEITMAQSGIRRTVEANSVTSCSEKVKGNHAGEQNGEM